MARIILTLTLLVGFVRASQAEPAWQSMAGQQATCSGADHKTFAIEMIEVDVDLGQGLTTSAWTFNGTVPGPTLEVCVGDTVTLDVTNKGTMAHGLDTHAFRIDAGKFGPIEPGRTLAITGTASVPGVFMYHCAAGPMTDQHIKMGMAGVMVVYPREPHGLREEKHLLDRLNRIVAWYDKYMR